MKDKIAIIGAGIGGLTIGLMLKQKGFNVEIFESSSEIKPVGAGIIIANNAMQVFQKLGMQAKIEKAGNRISKIKITDSQLNSLSVVDLSEYEQKYGVANIAIHRGELQRLLAEEIGYENIKLSKRLIKIEKEELFKLTFEDDSTIAIKTLIGADGIKSIVRDQLFSENTLRNANQICWRGVCEIDLPENYQKELNEAWGRGKRFGFVKLNEKKVYWYALANAKNVTTNEVNLVNLFDEFHKDIPSIISSTSKDQIITNEIIDLKPIYKWQSENVCLIGDAAHATTPNLGQGACQAIEDAYVLGKLIDDGFMIEQSFEQFEQLRRNKAHRIVNRSWTVGKIAHWENRIGLWIRNTTIKYLPRVINKRQMAMIFKLD
ncbi:FAD-dependent monooxygenase [Natronoflexus pectinivorans]|uniref:2-polyprenyl-6-methoxyphenol hydroxylase-like FAD-dependent oxidoreductase n=1 Tax=Natronoflexus pectinivorans TaxID=682526 RepID=A0A4R2GBY0_9BACT|nr:FAD-dependent monooxygenase [Natronoflexus pectinivorans]TCO05373.1 2-polyprenyl-6-methoxyphenol hydroxylase-like FAD-dependent oxidoreductase [Natronoflexus pectinivorans]